MSLELRIEMQRSSISTAEKGAAPEQESSFEDLDGKNSTPYERTGAVQSEMVEKQKKRLTELRNEFIASN